jgi:hypothetical protein
MKRRIRFALAHATATALIVPAASTPASASHYCGLEDASHTLNTICNGYHDPKGLTQYIVCIAVGDCPIG